MLHVVEGFRAAVGKAVTMFRFAVDENFDGRLVQGLRRRLPGVEIVRIQDEGLRGASDPEVLDWCAAHGYLLLTHDVRTMPAFLAQRMAQGQMGVGLLLVCSSHNRRQILDEFALIVSCSVPSEWIDCYRYVPLR